MDWDEIVSHMDAAVDAIYEKWACQDDIPGSTAARVVLIAASMQRMASDMAERSNAVERIG